MGFLRLLEHFQATPVYLEFRQSYAAALSGFCFIPQSVSILFLYILIFKLTHKVMGFIKAFSYVCYVSPPFIPFPCAPAPTLAAPLSSPFTPFCFHAMCVPLSLLPFPYNLSHLSHDLFVVVSQAHAHMHVHTHTHKMHTHVRACVHARGFLRLGLVHLRLTSNLMHCRR